MSNIKKSIPEGKERYYLDKVVNAIVDAIMMDPTIDDDDLPYILDRVREEIDVYFEANEE
jgi:hypothetical protein